MRWLWLGWLVAGDLWDDEMWHELATQAVRRAREAGALTVLPLALVYRAAVHVHAGEFAAASALIEEADAITEATGNAPVRYSSLLLVAWRGEEVQALKLIEAGAEEATTRGEGRAVGLAGFVTAVLYNGLGQYEAALAGARRACEYEDLGVFGSPCTSSSRPAFEAAPARKLLLPCAGSRSERAQSAQTGASAFRPCRARC